MIPFSAHVQLGLLRYQRRRHCQSHLRLKPALNLHSIQADRCVLHVNLGPIQEVPVPLLSPTEEVADMASPTEDRLVEAFSGSPEYRILAALTLAILPTITTDKFGCIQDLPIPVLSPTEDNFLEPLPSPTPGAESWQRRDDLVDLALT